MERLLLVVQILTFLGIVALRYFAKRFTEGVTGYVTEKGKNLATKEDIGEITREVESARLDFSAQIERLKTDLNANMQQQLSIFAKRNEALTQFFEDSFTSLTLLRSGYRYRYEDIDGLDKLIKQIQDRIIQAITSYHRLTLYVQEESILIPALNARTALSALLSTWWGLVHNFRDAFAAEVEEWKRAQETNDNSYFDQNKDDRPAGQALISLRQGTDSVLNTLDDSLKEYCNALNTHFHSVDKSKALAVTPDDSPEK